MVTPCAAQAVTPPQLLSSAEAAWPAGLTPAGEVSVPVVLVVSAEGRVEHAEVERSAGPLLDAAALQAAARWVFAPARGTNGPVRARVRALVRIESSRRATQPRPREAKSRSLEAPTDALGANKAPIAALGSNAAPIAAPTSPTPQEVVVRGTAAPRSASEIERDGRILRAAPHQTGSDLLLTVPGVFVSQHSGQGKAHQIFFRGFDAMHGQDVEFWVAGAPVNEVNHIHGQGYADLHFVLPEAVLSLRARPGAYDPRQGDFAVAGSMGFELGLAEPGLMLKGAVGSFGTRRGVLAYRPENASERTFVAAELQESDGFGPARRAHRASGMAQVEVGLGGAMSLTLMASLYASRFGSAGVVRLEDVVSGAMDRFDTYDATQGGHSMRSQLVATLRGSIGDVELELAPYFVQRSLLLRTNYTGFLGDPTHGDRNQQTNEGSTLGARAAARRRIRVFSPHDALEAGVSLRADFVSQSQRRISALDESVTKTEVDARVRSADLGLYVDAELHPMRRVTVRAGVRADGLSSSVRDGGGANVAAHSAQGQHVGTKATVDVVLADGLYATGSYGEGFRTHPARGLLDGATKPYSDVSSQELGARYQRDGVRAALAVYRTVLSDDLLFDEATAQSRGVPGTERLGVVADLVAQPVSWFSSAVSMTYTHAAFRESRDGYSRGDLVPYVPKLVLRSDVAASWTMAQIVGRALDLRVGAGTTYVLDRPLPYGEWGTDVMLLDAVIGARLGEVEVALEAYNLLDRSWNDGEFVYPSHFDPSRTPSGLPARHVTAGAPRQLLLSVALHL